MDVCAWSPCRLRTAVDCIWSSNLDEEVSDGFRSTQTVLTVGRGTGMHVGTQRWCSKRVTFWRGNERQVQLKRRLGKCPE